MNNKAVDKRLQLAKNLVKALEAGEEDRADAILDEIAGDRESIMFQRIGRLTRQLHDTMSSFSLDSRVMEITEKDIPDAKDRLNYVISMTEQAANETLNAVEELMPVTQQLNDQMNTLSADWDRFLQREMPFQEFKDMSRHIGQYFNDSIGMLAKIQAGLNEILMAQGFQDITGQIIRRVIELVQNLESNMVELIRLSGTKHAEGKAHHQPELPGPVVPGIDDREGEVASSQDDVDDLLSSLGF